MILIMKRSAPVRRTSLAIGRALRHHRRLQRCLPDVAGVVDAEQKWVEVEGEVSITELRLVTDQEMQEHLTAGRQRLVMAHLTADRHLVMELQVNTAELHTEATTVVVAEAHLNTLINNHITTEKDQLILRKDPAGPLEGVPASTIRTTPAMATDHTKFPLTNSYVHRLKTCPAFTLPWMFKLYNSQAAPHYWLCLQRKGGKFFQQGHDHAYHTHKASLNTTTSFHR